MMPSNVALDFLLEGFIDDSLVDACKDVCITGLVQDNRKARAGNVFFAYQGYHTHGLLYAQDAVAKGVSVVVWDGEVDNRSEILDSISDKALCIHCENLKYKVGAIASRYYEQPSLSLNMIGVTGTDGKTSIAHFLAQCLDSYDVHCGVLGTLGNGFINDLHPTGLTTVDALLIQKTLAEIQQAGAIRNSAQQLRVYQPPGGIQYRQVQADVLATRKKRRQRVGPLYLAGEAPGGLDRKRGVITYHVHTHGQGHLGDHGANGSQPYHTQCFTR